MSMHDLTNRKSVGSLLVPVVARASAVRARKTDVSQSIAVDGALRRPLARSARAARQGRCCQAALSSLDRDGRARRHVRGAGAGGRHGIPLKPRLAHWRRRLQPAREDMGVRLAIRHARLPGARSTARLQGRREISRFLGRLARGIVLFPSGAGAGLPAFDTAGRAVDVRPPATMIRHAALRGMPLWRNW